MLTLDGIHVSYSGSVALRGVDITLAAGELVAVIGPNGAGKSTLLRTISGLVRPKAGKITFEGADLGTLKPDEIVRRGIIHVPEGRMVLARMSVRENLLLGAYSRPRGEDHTKVFGDVLAMFPRLGERLDQLAGTLSGGEQQMLAIGRGLMGRPRLLMLDEPSLGLAPLIIKTIFDVIRDLRQSGLTILLVEQMAKQALGVADRAYVMETGHITLEGSGRELLDNPKVKAAYLGTH